MIESLKNIYKEHHQRNREAGFSIMEKERGEVLKNIIGDNKDILDLGCRDGALTKYFVKGNKVLGVDIDDVALQKAKDQLGIDVLLFDLDGDWGELAGRKFDIIVAGEILEHLYFPEKIIQKSIKHLQPKGKMIISVPNAFSLKNRIRLLLAQKHNTPLNDPTHINHFSLKELKKLFKKYFNDLEIIGLGRYKNLAKFFPGVFAFDIVINASNLKYNT